MLLLPGYPSYTLCIGGPRHGEPEIEYALRTHCPPIELEDRDHSTDGTFDTLHTGWPSDEFCDESDRLYDERGEPHARVSGV
jgi:hypothetical protein